MAGTWLGRVESWSPEEAFAWLLSGTKPVTCSDFLRDHWEKEPLHLRGDPGRFRGLLSQRAIEAQLASKGGLTFGKDINLARCGQDGQQIMCNGNGRANLDVVQQEVRKGCSVQVVHPQRFCPEVACLLSKLEAHFGCLWGANSFRTPPGGRGFKAHHDEVEVFMLQLEGAKRWRLHRCPTGALPRSYCWDYDEKDLGDPVMELVLKAGDLLYLPRGTIHKGEAVEGEASHHLTISTYQKFSWADFLQKALPEALERAASCDERFREGLPLRALSSLGEQHQPMDGSARSDFLRHLQLLMSSLGDHAAAAADATGDFLAAQFVARRLPLRCPGAPAAVPRRLALRWADPMAVRVVQGENGGEIQIYHSMENAAGNHMQPDLEPEPACIVLEGLEHLPALQALNRASGAWVLASSLGSPDLVEGLLEHGLLEIGDADLCDVQRVSGANGKKLKKPRAATARDPFFGRAGHRLFLLRHRNRQKGSSHRQALQWQEKKAPPVPPKYASPKPKSVCCCCWDKDEDSMSDWSDSDTSSSYESVDGWSPRDSRLPTYTTPKASTSEP